MRNKRIFLTGFLLGQLLLTQVALAGLKIPRSVFTMDKLDEAKAEAAEKSKPLIIVYTNPEST